MSEKTIEALRGRLVIARGFVERFEADGDWNLAHTMKEDVSAFEVAIAAVEAMRWRPIRTVRFGMGGATIVANVPGIGACLVHADTDGIDNLFTLGKLNGPTVEPTHWLCAVPPCPLDGGPITLSRSDAQGPSAERSSEPSTRPEAES